MTLWQQLRAVATALHTSAWASAIDRYVLDLHAPDPGVDLGGQDPYVLCKLGHPWPCDEWIRADKSLRGST